MNEVINKEKEEVIIAALMHLCCIIPFFGIIAPLIVWLLKKEKSFFLSFQCLQTIVYQSTGLIIFITGMILYTLSFFVVFISAIVMTGVSDKTEPSPIFFIFFAIPFIIFFLMFLLLFVYIIYGIIGFATTLIKKDFKYIFIGKKLESYLSNNTNTIKSE